MPFTRRVDERAHIGKLISPRAVQPSQSANKQAMASRRVLQPKTMHHRRVCYVSLLLSALLRVTSGIDPGPTPAGFTLVSTVAGDGCYADNSDVFSSIEPDGYTLNLPGGALGDATACGTACNDSYGPLATTPVSGFVGFRYEESAAWYCSCLFDTTVTNDPGQGSFWYEGDATSGPIINTDSGIGIPGFVFCYNFNGVSPVLAQYSYYELCC